MPMVYHRDVPGESFSGSATYQTLVGKAQGSTPVRIGIQMPLPRKAIPIHLHSAMRVLTMWEDAREAWMDGQEGVIKLAPGMIRSLPAYTWYGLRVTGDQPLTTCGVYVSPERVVHIHEE